MSLKQSSVHMFIITSNGFGIFLCTTHWTIHISKNRETLRSTGGSLDTCSLIMAERTASGHRILLFLNIHPVQRGLDSYHWLQDCPRYPNKMNTGISFPTLVQNTVLLLGKVTEKWTFAIPSVFVSHQQNTYLSLLIHESFY